ncbi:hypothetical protein [Chelativorans salis]|uniref:hypothetical protein n=1 Tax=Chelativorans salis TaxID=2978478 RepID=UPI0028CBB939|nr:hypothetical protein [Chelativorans sp. EGI FJ00035]
MSTNVYVGLGSTVPSFVYDKVTKPGTDGDDTLLGGDGEVVQGGPGDDAIGGGNGSVLSGGEGANRFVLTGSWGDTYVTDFQRGDKIDLSGVPGLKGFDQLEITSTGIDETGNSHAKVGVIVEFDGNRIVLAGVHWWDLTADDFIFPEDNDTPTPPEPASDDDQPVVDEGVAGLDTSTTSSTEDQAIEGDETDGGNENESEAATAGEGDAMAQEPVPLSLEGQAGVADTFAFEADEHGEVRDFELGKDKIDLSGIPGLTDFHQLSLHTEIVETKSDLSTRHSQDTILEFEGQVIRIVDLPAWVFDEADFTFAEENKDHGSNIANDESMISGDDQDKDLTGSNGDDTIIGGSGNDTIRGGEGDDILYGGPGADIFVFEYNGSHDRIMDFERYVDKVMVEGQIVYHPVEETRPDDGGNERTITSSEVHYDEGGYNSTSSLIIEDLLARPQDFI